MYQPEQSAQPVPQAAYPLQPPLQPEQQPMQYPPQQGYPQPGYTPQQPMPGYQTGYPQPGYAPQQPIQYPPPQGYPQQPYPQPQYYQPMQPQPIVIAPIQISNIQQVNTGYGVHKQKHSMLVRLIWFLFVGWWAGFWWIGIALFFCISIIGLPIGIWMFNRTGNVFFLD